MMGGLSSQQQGHGQQAVLPPASSVPGGLGAKDFLNPIDSSAMPPQAQAVKSAFETLGKSHSGVNPPPAGDANETLLKALTVAISGDKKSLPSWSGSMEALGLRLQQVSLWEMDSNMPKS